MRSSQAKSWVRCRPWLLLLPAALVGCGEVSHTLGRLRSDDDPLGNGQGQLAGAGAGNGRGPGRDSGIGTAIGIGADAGDSSIPVLQVDGSLIGCSATALRAQRKRLDLSLMVDTNFTLVISLLWPKVAGGLIGYVEDPRARGTGVGIDFFGKMPVVSILDCKPSDYTNPMQGVAELPDSAAAIASTVRGWLPIMGSPLLPAVQGALQYARGRADRLGQDADQAVVLIADGFDGPPCDVRPEDAAAAAAAALSADPPVRTYVVAIEVPNLANAIAQFTALDQIAVAGGTEHVRTLAIEGNAQSLVEILLEIQRDAESCEYAVPASLQGAESALAIEPPEGAQVNPAQSLLSHAPQAADCGEGFYLSADGTRATLCPDSCARVKQQHASLTWLSCN